MANRKKIQPVLHYDDKNTLVSGVGAGVGLAFVETYFSQAFETIRIASGYFQLTGFELARKKFTPNVQLRILVRGKHGTEGKNVQLTAIELIEQIVADLGQCQIPLAEAVVEIINRMDQERFFIRDAHEIEPFHCKFYICDQLFLWHGSSNFTNNGLCINAEQVSLIRNQGEIKDFIKWFDDVSTNSRDLLDLLRKRLIDWLGLTDPFDIYLKTLFLLLKDSAAEPLLESANEPSYFQKGVIEQALVRIDRYGGALVVAATGLGKTIIGAEIASRLSSSNKIKQVILLAPYNVFGNWDAECKGRRVHSLKSFNIKVPFLEISKRSYHQIAILINELKCPASEMLIIIDEAHIYRNQLLAQSSEIKNRKKESRVYSLLVPIVRKGAKIVLLTATAYSTSPQNMNSLLYLLPHKDRDMLGSNAPWNVDSTNQFASLPVVTTLGFPHVLKMARDRGDIDENGRVFIQLAETRRYLPKRVILHGTTYRLPFQTDLQKAFDGKYFDHSKRIPHTYCDADSVKIHKGVSDTVFNSSMKSWLSSSASMKSSLELNLSTEGEGDRTVNYLQASLFDNLYTTQINQPTQNGNGHSFKGLMILPLAERNNRLAPIYEQLRNQTVNDDEKFTELKTVLTKRCFLEKGKVLIFVNRFSTAIYLEEELKKAFGENLHIGCTVEVGKGQPQLKSNKVRSEILKTFSPNSHKHTLTQEEHNLLICTDADGIGVNLQDANTIVNYDPPSGADVLFQRVGRILRMTSDPERIIHIYTFLPSIIDADSGSSNIQKKIKDLFERLKQRQNKSGGISILGMKILTSKDRDPITLEESEIEDLFRENESVNNIDSCDLESQLRHISLLEKKGMRDRASKIPDYIFSARSYSKSQPRLFILFKYQENYYPVLYNIENEKIESDEMFEILDLIECDENEEKAPINIEKIENETLKAAEIWCAKKGFSKDEIIKICGLYLMPFHEALMVKNIFGNLRNNKK